MRADIERWDEKYRTGSHSIELKPDPLLSEIESLFEGGGVALDVACGLGQNAAWLAGQGYEVIGVDGSWEGLRQGRDDLGLGRLDVTLVCADLDCFAVPPGAFDAITVFRYLNRPLFPALAAGLRPGGLLVYKTFNSNLTRERPTFNTHFLLRPGELAELLGELDCLQTNDTPDLDDRFSWWVGRRPVLD